MDDAITTDRVETTGGTPIGVREIAVIALLYVGMYDPVTTAGFHAVIAASIAIVGIPIVIISV